MATWNQGLCHILRLYLCVRWVILQGQVWVGWIFSRSKEVERATPPPSTRRRRPTLELLPRRNRRRRGVRGRCCWRTARGMSARGQSPPSIVPIARLGLMNRSTTEGPERGSETAPLAWLCLITLIAVPI